MKQSDAVQKERHAKTVLRDCEVRAALALPPGREIEVHGENSRKDCSDMVGKSSGAGQSHIKRKGVGNNWC